VIWLLVVLWMVVVTSVMLWRVERIASQNNADHAKCIAHISSVVSRRVVAEAMRTAAEKWDSVENQLVIGRIRNEYVPDGTSVPALWLREQADLMEAGR
jgi:hypothetical protein